jgi:D-apionolactonase
MQRASESQRLFGSDEPPPAARELRAGPLTLLLEGADLRYIRFGSRELVRRLYVAVRDHNWDTIPLQLSNLEIRADASSFQVSFDAAHVQGGVDFAWRGAISGGTDGTISYSLDGAPRSRFRRNRIGLCILYPVRECAGQPCEIFHVDGSLEESVFPLEIGPQLVIDGVIWPVLPFADMRGIAHEVVPGVTAITSFEGDTFEMEDQRNWTDASYKIYSTPLALPWPVEVGPDTAVAQRFSLRLELAQGALASADTDAEGGEVTVQLGEATRPLPKIGLGFASHGEPLSARELALLRALHPAHLRVDLDLASAGYLAVLAAAAQQAASLGAALEVALFCSDAGARELEELRGKLADLPPIARWLVFHQREKTTPAWLLEQARAALPGAPVGGGTNVYFTELNRSRPPLELVDVVAYSINPQVHAFDNRSLVETLAAQGATVASARAFCGDRPLAVSPVTLRPRFNPNATGPEPAPAPGELPSQVDPRQASLLGAGWTLGSLKYLGEAGADSITYYETTGWRGLLEREHGPALPEAFPSQAGQLFPLYHVFAALAPFATDTGGSIVASESSAPLRVEALALRAGGRTRILLASFDEDACAITLHGLPEGAAQLRVLDAGSYAAAMDSPQLLNQGGEPLAPTGGVLSLELAPFAVVCVDIE